MRTPATYLAGHIMFTRFGTAWATWRLTGTWYRHAPHEQKLLARAQHQALWQKLRGEAMLLGLCADIDPAEVVQGMCDGIDLNQQQLWLDNAEAALGSLSEIGVGERTYWLAVPLASVSPGGVAKEVVSSGVDQVRELLALPRRVPSDAEIRALTARADRLESLIPSVFRPKRATAAQQLWISLHMQMRGLGSLGPVPPAGEAATSARHTSGFLEPWLDEGGQSDLEPRERLAVHRHRYLKLISGLSDEPSYQAMIALASTPKEGWEFPGLEWVSRLDDFDFDVDWCQRVRISSGDVARRRNKTRHAKLKDQLFQQDEGESDDTTSGVPHLQQIRDDLKEYQTRLAADEREIEVRHTTIAAVSGRTPELATAAAAAIRADGEMLKFLWDQPIGGQEQLWWAMQPGTPLARGILDYEQITTGANFATAIPLVDSGFGSHRGFLLGFNRTTGRRTPVLWDSGEAISGDKSSSFAATGELGSGKSVFMKCAIVNGLARNERAVVVDPTSRREYAAVVGLASSSTMLVDPLRPICSLDPLRVFTPEAASRIAQTMFATMLGVGVLDPLGAVLSELLDAVYLRREGIGSLGQLRTHLAERQEPEMRELLRLVNVIASKDLGQILFDEQLPALSLESQAIVFSTTDLDLPSESDLGNPQLFRQMSIEKFFGHAMYALIAGIGREICIADSSTLAGFYIDEAASMHAPRGQAIIKEFITDGRKHAAFIGLAGQVVEHLGAPELRGLIPARFAFRQSDAELAAGSAAWVADGLEAARIQELSPEDETGRVPADRRGEAMARDPRGRIARVKVQMPFAAAMRDALSTTPELQR